MEINQLLSSPTRDETNDGIEHIGNAHTFHSISYVKSVQPETNNKQINRLNSRHYGSKEEEDDDDSWP